MYKLFLLLILSLCNFSIGSACKSCMLMNGYYKSYYYNGNIKTVNKIVVKTKYDSLGNTQSIDTTSIIFNKFLRNKKSQIFSMKSLHVNGENNKHIKTYYERHDEKGNLLELKGDFPYRNMDFVYDDNGVRREAKIENRKIYYNSKGEEDYAISYDKDGVYNGYTKYTYNKNGKEKTITNFNKYDSITNQTIYKYNKQGNVTEEYKDGLLINKKTYDKKGRCMEDYSYYTNKINKYEYNKREKIKYEYENGILNFIEKCDVKGNRIYFKSKKTEINYTYNKDNQLINETYIRLENGGTSKTITNYKPNRYRSEEWIYRNDTLITYYKDYVDTTSNGYSYKYKNITINGHETTLGTGVMVYDTIIRHSGLTTNQKGDTLELIGYNWGIQYHKKYLYNDFGKKHKIITHSKQDDEVYNDTTYFDYDKQQNLISTYISSDGNIVTKTEYVYDSSNKLTSKSTYNNHETEIETFDNNGNQIEFVHNEFRENGIINKKTVATTSFTYYDE